jgi:hypothetical protein
MLQEYSQSQRKDWQKVPYLALEADGRRGYLDTYAIAYEDGLWIIDRKKTTGVDLRTGTIVGTWNGFRPVKDGELWNISPKALDAHATVQSLREEAAQEHASYYSSEQIQELEHRRKRHREALKDLMNRPITENREPIRSYIF